MTPNRESGAVEMRKREENDLLPAFIFHPSSFILSA